MADIVVGLPSLSRGPLLDVAREIGAPVMVSATALARWRDDGPLPPGHEFNALERRIRVATGDQRPPSEAQRRRRARSWSGWNTAALDRLTGTGLDLRIDSAGFVAMSMFNGFPWTVEAYLDLCVHPAIRYFSSMDLCVEREVAPDFHEVEERIAKTVRLNRLIARLSDEAGVRRKLMPVIQGADAEGYLRCWEGVADLMPESGLVGVGSMCRRPTSGSDGSLAVLDRLDREMPRNVRWHLFGIKSDGAESAVSAFGGRVASFDSQAYGVRARRIANERRAEDPSFSKTNLMVSGVMRDWYRGQEARMRRLRPSCLQPEMALASRWRPRTVLDALERVARAQLNALIADGALEHDQIIGGRMLEEATLEMVPDLPPGVGATDGWTGSAQLPEGLMDETWFPDELRDG